MSRHTYNCGGKGRKGKGTRNPCTYCGKIHPRGKKKKAGFDCKGTAIKKKKEN